MNENAHVRSPAEKIHDLDEVTRRAGAKKVLIVDDEPDLVGLIQAQLESFGYFGEGANDGVQAIKKIMVNEYSVILCDMIMPNLAGDMFYLAVERVKPHLCPKFVFMTGFHEDPKIEAFIRKVRGVILWKPFKIHALIEAIQAAEKRS